MAVYSGPNIVTDGIVLHLDKYNEESYLGEPTTNIVPNGDFASYTGGLPSGWSAYNSTAMMTAVTADLPNGKTGTVMQAGPTWPTGSVCGVQANLGARTSGQTETVSFWYRILNTNAGTGNFWCGIWDYPDTRDIYFNTSTNTDWTYFSKAFTLTTDNSTRYYRFLTSDSSNLTGTGFTLQLWNVQYEANSHATKFVDGTRPEADNWRDLSGNDYHADMSSQVYSATNVPGTNVNNFPASSSGYLENVVVYSSADMPLGNEPRTMEAWFSKTNSSASNALKIIYGWGDLGVNGGHCYLAHNYEKPFFWGYSTADLSGTTALTTDVMYHMVVTWDGYTKRIYLNAVQEATDTVGLATADSRSYFYLGKYTYGAPRRNEGYLDVVRVYDRALSAAEVLQNFNASKGRYGL
jgi:hypothetical protein